ncbi:MAG: hypothetical protein JO321_07130 [Solirubrobacterales bacterium]|nr:hypothetical protein [Solirubrobacterales bacterium]MBV9535170.1 hypothetical protein [Solirubrobacterales bacterium]
MLFAVIVASAGEFSPTLVLMLFAVALGFQARRCLHLAARSCVDARSEDEVRRVLASLRGEGWRVRHSLSWRGRGDIDSLAVAPAALGSWSR